MKALKGSKSRPALQTQELQDTVSALIDQVRAHGDEAILEFSRQFDGSERRFLRVSANEAKAALDSLAADDRAALEYALEAVKTFAEAQRASIHEIPSFSPTPGLTLGHRLIPVDSVCCYVPGGAYPLCSTALMLIAPASVAGVSRIAACSPVMKGTSTIHPVTLAAMTLAGAHEIYAVGGAQAIAAFAYGSEQIKPVDLIVGPGNAYVAEAKRQCYGQVGIDFIAGPSEILIIADDSAHAALIAADLLAQCEHDSLAQAILVTTSPELAAAVLQEIERQLLTLATAQTAQRSWTDFGEIHVAENLNEAVDFANARASEHLELQTRTNDTLIPQLRNYGSLFIGEYAAEVFGDYAAGPNHTLPTLRASRYTGGLWVGTFLKALSFQRVDPIAAAALAPVAARLAHAEGLAAHAAAASARNSAPL
ncbi:MAG: histidinol dehydrogenase [Spirochaetaceae bacterium]|jgi:histidinol dehydrogenase|nr:histidinol dehydrogenase [Spirochaetaceae bacterium]